MKTLLVAFALAALSQGQLPAQSGQVSGQVTSITGQPLKNATVRLQQMLRPAAPPQPGQIPPQPQVFNTTTDEAGSFHFESIQPGQYSVHAQRAGYLIPREVPSIMAGATQPARISIQLTPESRIEGRVTNQEGEPMAGTQVSLYRWAAVGPHLELIAAPVSATVADDGSYVMGNIPAGHYYLRVSQNTRNIHRGQQEQTPRETDIPTYFPGVAAASSAAQLSVAGGAVMQGLDIRMLRGTLYGVRGAAVDRETGAPLANLMLTFSVEGAQSGTAVTTKADGTFELSLQPGEYAPSARLLPPRRADGRPTPAVFSEQRITVGKENVEDAVLQFGPGTEIQGRFILEDEGQQAPGPSRPPTLIVDSLGPNVAGANQVENSGAGGFMLHNLGPGEYAPRIMNLPSGSYVKSVRFGQQDMPDQRFQITSGAGGPLEIVLSQHAADVSGVVRNSKGDPLVDKQVYAWKPGQAVSGFAMSGPGGAFSIGNLAPGEYRIAAWDGEGMLPVAQFLSQFETQAATVKLDQDSHQTVDVPVIRQDAIDAAIENLR